MRETLRALQAVAHLPGVEGVALVGGQGQVLSDRLDEQAEALAGAVASARLLFRSTAPSLRSLDLRFAGGRLLLLPAGAAMLVVRLAPAVAAADIRREVAAQAEALGRLGQVEPFEPREPDAPAEEPRAQLLPPGPGGAVALAGLQCVIDEARKVLGGAVLRNYLRRTQGELAPRWPWLASLQIDLAAQVRGEVPADGGPALGAWARAMLVRAATVVPELGRLDLPHLTAGLAPQLTRTGFHDRAPAPGEPR